MSSTTARPLCALCERLLANVTGGKDPGYNPADDALGRVGWGTSWKWLGNYYTPEALAHDKETRRHLAHGDSLLKTHVLAAPKLPAAVGSYVRARLHPGPDDMHLPD